MSLRQSEDRCVGGTDGPQRNVVYHKSPQAVNKVRFHRHEKGGELKKKKSLAGCLWTFFLTHRTERGFKVGTGGIIDAPFRKEDPHLNNNLRGFVDLQ